MHGFVGVILFLILVEAMPVLAAIAVIGVNGYLLWLAVSDYRSAAVPGRGPFMQRFRAKQERYWQRTLQAWRRIAGDGVADGWTRLLLNVCHAVTNVTAWPIIALVDLIAVQGGKALLKKLRACIDDIKAGSRLVSDRGVRAAAPARTHTAPHRSRPSSQQPARQTRG